MSAQISIRFNIISPNIARIPAAYQVNSSSYIWFDCTFPWLLIINHSNHCTLSSLLHQKPIRSPPGKMKTRGKIGGGGGLIGGCSSLGSLGLPAVFLLCIFFFFLGFFGSSLFSQQVPLLSPLILHFRSCNRIHFICNYANCKVNHWLTGWNWI